MNVNDIEKYKVPVDKLRNDCSICGDLNFCQTSKDVSVLEGVIGQDRAVKSMEFGLSMEASGYNIFVLGPQGTGKTTYSQTVVSKAASKRKVPDDWCYINNFSEWDKPLAISLPAGQGKVFQKDMEKLITNLVVYIPKAFESSNFQQQKDDIIQKTNKQMTEILRDIDKIARNAGFGIQQAANRILLIPLVENRQITQEEFSRLTEEEREKIDEKRNQTAKEIDDRIRDGQMVQRLAEEKAIEIQKQTAKEAAEPFIEQLKEKYKNFPEIADYLDKVLKDAAENHVIFSSVRHSLNENIITKLQDDSDSLDGEEKNIFEKAASARDSKDPFTRYKVNLFINNENTKGAPVITESSPYYYNLFGKIEYKSHMMTTMTDFTMIKPGAIHKANGGYLILQVKDLLMDPFAWGALKKALKYKEAVVENIGEQSRYVPTVTLKPQPIPLNVKVILIGSYYYYQFLAADEDFRKLFKVNVDFDVEMDRTRENIRNYVSFIASMCENENLKHFNCEGLAKVVEYGSRLADNQNKLSTRFNIVSEIVYEASALAEADNSEYVEGKHVNQAIKNKKYRSNRIEEKMQE
ncbi:MAG TPA: ATP-binding protein, partial [Sedimentibacter sp.]|nr:ATP-binding protein [Sedimentibacter sp.]